MPRKRTARSSNDGARRRANGGVTQIRAATSSQSESTTTYLRDPRWATAVRRRTDVYVVDITDRFPEASSSSDDEPMLLTA